MADTLHNPSTIAPPARNLYARAVEAPAGSRRVYISGRVGILPDGLADPAWKVEADLIAARQD